jgi:uncharacterized phage infection (PIP) family protein YhgE
MKKSYGLVLIVLLVIGLSACKKKDQTQLNNALLTIQQGTQQGVSAVKDAVTQTKQDYQRSIQRQIDQISRSIDQLNKKAETVDDQAKADIQRTVNGLQIKRDALQEKLDQLKSSTADAWKDMVAGINDSLVDLQKAADRAISQYK